MKKFEVKLRECASHAHQNTDSDETLPFRFAEDVMHRLSIPETVDLFQEGLWLRFGLPTLAGMTLALLILSLMPSASKSPGHLLPPPIEHSIVDYSGLL